MMLKQLKAHHFRNYLSFDFTPSPTTTLVFGDNGSGKTSLLEAIYLLGSGKSFRTSRLQYLLGKADEAEEFYLHAQLQVADVLHRVGMSRNKNTFTGLRLNGETVPSLSEFAKLFPVHVFHSGSVELVYGSAEIRRRFLDWGLFHVEHSFHALWKTLHKIVRQRNQLLKQSYVNPAEIKVWDEQLVLVSDKITALRRVHLEHIDAYLQHLCADMIGGDAIKITLSPGWAEGTDLAQGLADSFEIDRQRGFTSRGAHRADIRLTINGLAVKEMMSRGQIKTLTILLGLAQLMYLVNKKELRTLILVDDMAAELDSQHMGYLVDKLSELQQQVIYTALAPQDLPDTLITGEGVKMFHVEHGVLKDCLQTKANHSEGNNDDR